MRPIIVIGVLLGMLIFSTRSEAEIRWDFELKACPVREACRVIDRRVGISKFVCETLKDAALETAEELQRKVKATCYRVEADAGA